MTQIIGFVMFHLGWLGFLIGFLNAWVSFTDDRWTSGQAWFGVVMAIICFVIFIVGYAMKEA